MKVGELLIELDYIANRVRELRESGAWKQLTQTKLTNLEEGIRAVAVKVKGFEG